MATIFLLCGKGCSGKTTYAKQLKSETNGIILSCDELMLHLFDEQLGDKHEIYLNKVKQYLIELAIQIIQSEMNVILDFGFWQQAERKSITSHFVQRGINVQWYYIRINDEQWLRRIDTRNKADKHLAAYYIDEALRKKMDELFQEPSLSEIDVIIDTI